MKRDLLHRGSLIPVLISACMTLNMMPPVPVSAVDTINVTVDFGSGHTELAALFADDYTVNGSMVTMTVGNGTYSAITDSVSEVLDAVAGSTLEASDWLHNSDHLIDDSFEDAVALKPLSEYTTVMDLFSESSSTITDGTTLYVLWQKPVTGAIDVTIPPLNCCKKAEELFQGYPTSSYSPAPKVEAPDDVTLS